MRGRFFYGAFGVVLIIVALFTSNYGIHPDNRQSYELALNLQKQVDGLTFPNFRLQDYPVRCYDGTYDYVFLSQDVKVHMEKQNPVLGIIAGTAYEVDGTYQVIVPTIDKFHDLLSLMDAVSGIQNETFTFGEQEYGKEEQATVIWHEATHAWQFTNYKNQILNRIKKGEAVETSSVLSREVDENVKVVTLYQQEMDCLLQAVNAESIDAKISSVLKYKELEEQRRSLLPEEILAMEEYYESVEGIAYYVESKVYEILHGRSVYEENYITPICQYLNGTHKYCSMGMAKCLLLDEVSKNWKSSYDYSISLTQLLYETYGVNSLIDSKNGNSFIPIGG